LCNTLAGICICYAYLFIVQEEKIELEFIAMFQVWDRLRMVRKAGWRSKQLNYINNWRKLLWALKHWIKGWEGLE